MNGAERSYIELIVWAGLVTMALLPGDVGAGRPVTPADCRSGSRSSARTSRTARPIDFARRLGEVIRRLRATAGV